MTHPFSKVLIRMVNRPIVDGVVHARYGQGFFILPLYIQYRFILGKSDLRQVDGHLVLLTPLDHHSILLVDTVLVWVPNFHVWLHTSRGNVSSVFIPLGRQKHLLVVISLVDIHEVAIETPHSCNTIACTCHKSFARVLRKNKN